MKTKLLAMMFLAGVSMFAQTRLSIGIGVGGNGAGFYQPPPAYASNIPPCPGPDYTWVDGYWSQAYGHRTWIAGFWSRQPFTSGFQAAPRFDNRFNRDGDRRDFDHAQNRGFDHGDRSRSNGQADRRSSDSNGFRGR